MSYLWGEALKRAFPRQKGRIRPSGIGNCALNQAANVNGITPTDGNSWTIWQAELGRAGQTIALKAFEHLGFDYEETIEVDGPIAGEGDAIVVSRAGNILGWEPGRKLLADVKVRAMYPYLHVWEPDADMMMYDAAVGLQLQTYAGQLGIEDIMVLLLPFDGSACRNEQNFGKGRKNEPYQDVSPYVRIMTGKFNPSLYRVALERKAQIEQYGLSITREANPYATPLKFPCSYCEFLSWCKDWTPEGSTEGVTPVPKYGMPMTERRIG